MNSTLLNMELENDSSTDALIFSGYRGKLLKAKLRGKAPEPPLMVAHSEEHLELLAKAKTHGSQFFATGGRHSTCDDVFLSAEISLLEAEIKTLEASKTSCLFDVQIRYHAMKIMDANIDIDKLIDTQL